MPDFHRFALPFRAGLARGEVYVRDDALGLLVKKRGKQRELHAAELHAARPVGDSAFAHDDGLPPRPEGLADHVPLFERLQHGGEANRKTARRPSRARNRAVCLPLGTCYT